MRGVEHFFIVGAQRSGTTYLYELLNAHPQIEMAAPRSPEPKFFLQDHLYASGLEWYEERFFGWKPGVRLRGEKSTSYIESEKAAGRIAQAYPAANILFLLRDPIERAKSNYRFSCRNGVETLSFERAIMEEPKRIHAYDPQRFSVSPYAYLARGRYIDYLRIYERCFPRPQLCVLQYERLVNSLREAQALYATLGVDPEFVPPTLDEVVNAAPHQELRLPPEVEQYMKVHFLDSTRLLSQEYGINLDLWSSAKL